MKGSEMMRMANTLCAALENCTDDDFVDLVIEAICSNIPFDEDDIAAQEAAEEAADEVY